MLRAFAAFAVLIACLGLFGLAAYAAERRTKEIGIRRILGATVPEVVLLLCREFLGLIALANALAAPVAYILMRRSSRACSFCRWGWVSRPSSFRLSGRPRPILRGASGTSRPGPIVRGRDRPLD